MVAMLAVVAAVRLRLLNFPLERDEGEYAHAGQLMRQGIPPCQLAYNMKFPGTYAACAVIMALFGQTPAGIHITNAVTFVDPATHPVSPMENMSLTIATGWRSPAQINSPRPDGVRIFLTGSRNAANVSDLTTPLPAANVPWLGAKRGSVGDKQLVR
jgi:hypothetical protein